MSGQVVVNFAKGGWYPRGQARLAKSLVDVGYSGRLALYSGEGEIPAPSHAEIPYAFKPAAMLAAGALGTSVLWLDAAAWAVKNPDPVFREIEAVGYVLFGHGWMVGQWTNDRTLDYFGVTRDKAMEIPMLSACAIGFDLARPDIAALVREWNETKGFFSGMWKNDGQTESKDARCLGHRHDQSVLSLLVHTHGLRIRHGQETYAYLVPDAEPPATAIFHARGM